MKEQLSHIDQDGNPQMVDVSSKSNSVRVARASATVKVAREILSLIRNGEIVTKKGPVFQTAILAGIMAAKKTSDLIPLCHPLGLEDCKVEVRVVEGKIEINTMVRVEGKTGVEMEALTAASVAALTIYDMCKALSHEMVIEEIKLMEKSGGKQNFKR